MKKVSIAFPCITGFVVILFLCQRLAYSVNPRWFDWLWTEFGTTEGLRRVYRVIVETQVLIIIGAGWSVWLVNKQFQAMVLANSNATKALSLAYRPIGVFYSEVRDDETATVSMVQGIHVYDFWAKQAKLNLCLKCVSKDGFLRLRGVLTGYGVPLFTHYTANDDLVEAIIGADSKMRIKTDEYLTEGQHNKAWTIDIDVIGGASYRVKNNLLLIAFYDDVFGNLYGTALLHAYPDKPFTDGTDLVKLLEFTADQREQILKRIESNP